jgi:putative transcriptional regulator
MDSLRAQLLVASPRLPDVNFYRTVVLIIQHTDEGAFGVVLNRLTENTISDVWATVGEQPCDVSQPMHLGGPVEGPLVALHANAAYSENEVLPGVHFAAHKDYLNQIVRDSEFPFRLYSGYSGWAPGQLEGEMSAGGWMVLQARSEHVFGEPDELWKMASREIGEQITGQLLRGAHMPDESWMN